MNLEFVTAPLIGGIIGLVTNGIAIKMLFRPLHAIYIGKYKLPFTPGLIPKERPRIAKAVGDMISNNLLDRDTLMHTLLSDSIKEQIFSKIDDLIDKYKNSDETAGTVMGKLFSEDVVREKLNDSKEAVALVISNRAKQQDIGRIVAEYVCDEIISRTKPVLKSLTKSALNSVKQPFENTINTMVEEKTATLVEKFLDSQAEDILNKPLKDVIEAYQEKIPVVKKYFWDGYEGIVIKKLSSVLEAVDISGIVSDKINGLELITLENMIMTLMRKELRALVWLGGLLGFVMGFVNILIDKLM